TFERWPETTAPSVLAVRLDHHAHEVREGIRAHLLHDTRAVDLDRALADVQVAGDDLVGLALRDQFQNLALARRQLRHPPADFVALLELAAHLAVLFERAVDPVDEVLVA